MSLFDILRRHPRGHLSAYADGELVPARREAIEAHLTGCQRCRTELDELLAVRATLRELPQEAAPRSFALTPELAEGEPRPAVPAATSPYVAMRLAGAGLAAVLAVVVFLDAGGLIEEGGDDDATQRVALEDDAGGFELAGDTDTFDAAPEAPDAAGGPPSDGEADRPVSGGAEGGGAAGAIPTPGAAAEQDGDLTEPDGLEGGDDRAAGGDGAPASDGGGPSTLLVIEIALGALAVLAIGGSFLVRRLAESR